MSDTPVRKARPSDKPLPKCRECHNEPTTPREIKYGLNTVPYATVHITVPSCWRCGRWAMTDDAQAVIEKARNNVNNGTTTNTPSLTGEGGTQGAKA